TAAPVAAVAFCVSEKPGFYITITAPTLGKVPLPGHRVRNGLDVHLKNGKGEARHAYLWGACEPGGLPVAVGPVDHGPERSLIDDQLLGVARI
ncbi:hypothetical protein ACFU5P_19420, partial [Streptomyces sp. NPDC057433]|uniref:hypothetical protein n=1 Tax=Streptomyces sp. NPDC057433 TaxID=3346132 RepID=UPI00367864A2